LALARSILGIVGPMHPSTEDILRHFEYDHLPDTLQAVSAPVCRLAKQMAEELDGPELTAGLRKLLEAKDCFVRAAVPPKVPKRPSVDVFSRDECIFAYCPNPDDCQLACRHPATRSNP
jgi:hypothetical protein